MPVDFVIRAEELALDVRRDVEIRRTESVGGRLFPANVYTRGQRHDPRYGVVGRVQGEILPAFLKGVKGSEQVRVVSLVLADLFFGLTFDSEHADPDTVPGAGAVLDFA